MAEFVARGSASPNSSPTERSEQGCAGQDIDERGNISMVHNCSGFHLSANLERLA
jgi:hypothetical protein